MKMKSFIRQSRKMATIGVAFVCFMTVIEPAFAQAPISTSGADSGLSGILHSASTKLHALIDMMGKQIATDTSSVNHRQDSNYHVAATSAVANAVPATHSFCYQAASAGDSGERASASRALGGAMVQAGSNRPNDTTTLVNEVKAEMDAGLVPCPATAATAAAPGDPDASAYKTLNCKRRWGGAYEKSDQSMDVLFGSYSKDTLVQGQSITGNTLYELPVPPEYKNLQNGVYQPVPVPSAQKYMPFVAAYSFCQRINPKRCVLPQFVSGKPTVDIVAAGPKNDADAKMSTAYSLCMNLLAERMTFDSTANASFSTLRDTQHKSCTDDFGLKWFDSADNTYCQQNGRSELQAKQNMAYQDMFQAYHATYTVGADRNTLLLLDSSNKMLHMEFDKYVSDERKSLEEAIAAANSVPSVCGNQTLSTPVN